MKIKVTAQNPEFKPITLEIVFESQNEVDAFYALINCSPVVDTIEKMGGAMPSYKVLKDQISVDKAEEFLNILKNGYYVQHNWKPSI